MDRRSSAWFSGWGVTRKGSFTSGNYQHRGRKGQHGGSAPGGGHGAIEIMTGTPGPIARSLIRQYREDQKLKAAQAKKPRSKQAQTQPEAPPTQELPKEAKFSAKNLRSLNKEWGHKLRQLKRRMDQVLVRLKQGLIGKSEANRRIKTIKQIIKQAQTEHDRLMVEFKEKK